MKSGAHSWQPGEDATRCPSHVTNLGKKFDNFFQLTSEYLKGKFHRHRHRIGRILYVK